MHGFRWEQAAGVEFSGKSGQTRHFLILGQAVDDTCRATENDFGFQDFIIGKVFEPFDAFLPPLPILAPSTSPALLEDAAHAQEVGFNALLGFFNSFVIGRGDVHRETDGYIARLTRMSSLLPR